jgi:integrase
MARDRSGMIFERGKGIWYARVTFTDTTGRRRYVKRRGENKSDAKEIVKRLLREIEDSGGAVVEGNGVTLGKYLDRWLQVAARPRVSDRTFADYEDLLRRYVRPAMSRKRLSDVRPLDIQALYSRMQTEGGSWYSIVVYGEASNPKRKQKRAKDEADANVLLREMRKAARESGQEILKSHIETRPLSARTVRYTHAVLTSAFKQAVKWGLLPRNPASLVELPKQARKEMSALSPEEAARFVEACSLDRLGVLFKFALATGMRPEEYLGLQWKDIDLRNGVATVQRTLCWHRKGGGWSFGEPKTARSRRSMPLPSSLVQALAVHKRAQAEERLKAGAAYATQDLVFATSAGGPLMPQNFFRRHFRPILKRAGLPDSIRLYDLRHSCATLLLSANENPKVVSERLGHASIVLTLDTYSHVLPSMQQAASDKLERILFGT